MTSSGAAASFILTLEFDAESFAWLNALRIAHFPRERNLIPAHLTFFHKLDAAQAERVAKLVEAESSPRRPQHRLALTFSGVRSLGRGVAVVVDAPALATMRARLARDVGGALSAQDSQGFRPHVTIQNKVAPDVARRLHADLARDWVARHGEGTALLLWRYLGGPWELQARWPFR